MITQQSIAEISLSGSILEALGGLYLSYDLLGGKSGPLRTLTRVVSYSLLFSIAYSLLFGLAFGLVAGVGVGGTIGLEFSRASHGRKQTFYYDFAFLAARGFVLGIAGWLLYGKDFGFYFGISSCLLMTGLYAIGSKPSKSYEFELQKHPGGQGIARPHLHHFKLYDALGRAIAIGLAAFIGGIMSRGEGPAIHIAIFFGLAVGAVSVVFSTITPVIEWHADNLPERRLGTMGAVAVVIGFLLQTLQYVVVAMKIPIR